MPASASSARRAGVAVPRSGGAALGPIAAGVLALALAALVSVTVGKAALPWTMPFRMLGAWLGIGTTADLPAYAGQIMMQIRLPRIVLAGLAGCGLAVAGAAYQALFRNPLADPYLLGISSGASLGAVLGFILPLPFGLVPGMAVPALAFAGGLATVAAVYAVARSGGGTSTSTLLLAGVALGAIANAVTSYLMYLRGDQLLAIYSWLLGGFNIASWNEVRLAAPVILASAAALALGGRTLNVLQFGDEQAASLGIDVERTRLWLVVAATLGTAAAVSAGGLIGFVGLVVPHAVRLVFGPDQRLMLPLSALFGAAFLISADAAARALPGPGEVPVGVVTALIGAPVFLYLLNRQRSTARLA